MEVGIKWYVVALILTHAKIAIASSISYSITLKHTLILFQGNTT